MNEEQILSVMEDNGGNLTDEQMAILLDGGELETGDTDTDEPTRDQDDSQESKESPVEDEAPEGDQDQDVKEGPGSKDDADTGGEEPVIMAKDGKHTIPYEKLVETRETVKTLKSITEQQAQIIDSMKGKGEDQEQDQQADEGQPVLFDFTGKRREMMEAWEDGDEDRYREIDEEIQHATEQKIADMAAKVVDETLSARNVAAEQAGAVSIQDSILAAHPELNEDGNEFYAFIGHRDRALAEGKPLGQALKFAEESVFPGTDKKATAGDTAVDGADVKSSSKVAGKIKEAEDKATAPASLSDIPGGAAHHDESEAMREMSVDNLMDKFAGKSTEQIEELLSRAL